MTADQLIHALEAGALIPRAAGIERPGAPRRIRGERAAASAVYYVHDARAEVALEPS